MVNPPELELATTSLESLFTEAPLPDTRQKFLRIQLCPATTALLAIEQIAAIVTVAVTDILPVPQMPEPVLGVYNWRGEMLWLVDLSCQVGFASLLASGHAFTSVMAIVLQVDNRLLGLAVSQVHDIEKYPPEHLEPPPAGFFPPKLLSFTHSYQTDDGSAILNPSALLQDPFLQVN